MRRLVICLCLGMLFAGTLVAQEAAKTSDVVYLKNGQDLTGTITGEDEKTVTLLMERGGEIVLPKRRIKEVVRGERASVEKKAIAKKNLLRYDARDEFFFVYYRGQCVGWRQATLEPTSKNDIVGYQFTTRTVYFRDKEVDIDVTVTEFIDQELRPRSITVTENAKDASTLTEGTIEEGHLELRTRGPEGFIEREILFTENTRLALPLQRQLADSSIYPKKGESFKVYDPISRTFKHVHATRSLRKEIVAGRHQFVTVWKMTSGAKSWEVWIDGRGGVVREELGGTHMIAMRAPSERVLAFARGEGLPDGAADLSLTYANEPDGFSLVRPNLTWSFEFPDLESPHAITLLNPTLQASMDVVVIDGVGQETAPETVVLQVLDRMRREAGEHAVAYQKPTTVGGADGFRFEVTSTRRGTPLRTIGAVTVAEGKAFALLGAAPVHRFHEASPHLEKILASFEIERKEKSSAKTQQ